MFCYLIDSIVPVWLFIDNDIPFTFLNHTRLSWKPNLCIDGIPSISSFSLTHVIALSWQLYLFFTELCLTFHAKYSCTLMVIIIWRQPEGILWMSYLLLFSCHLKSKGKRCKAAVIFKHSGRSFVINCRYRWCWFSGDLSTSLSLNLDLVCKLSGHDMEALVVDSSLHFTKQIAVRSINLCSWFRLSMRSDQIRSSPRKQLAKDPKFDPVFESN